MFCTYILNLINLISFIRRIALRNESNDQYHAVDKKNCLAYEKVADCVEM